MIIGLGTVALIWFLQLFFMNNYYGEMKFKEVVRTASSISYAYQRGDANLNASIKELSVNNDFYVFIESENGIILFSPQQEVYSSVSGYMDEAMKLKGLLEASGGAPVHFEVNSKGKYNILAYGCQLTNKNGEQAVLYIFSPLYPVSSTINILKHQLFYVTAMTLVLAVTLAIYFSNRISKPIKSMTSTAEEMGKGTIM